MLASGKGYCDRYFGISCTACGAYINHERLRAGKFCNDIKQLLDEQIPMGGTLLGNDGIPYKVGSQSDISCKYGARTINEFFLQGLGQKVLGEDGTGAVQSMDEVRNMIETSVKDTKFVAKVKGYAGRRLSRTERVMIRKMMSRYWENSSPFALDLVGAVIRQGSFVEKMHNIDWLHSPALPSTMGRLITKYGRFVMLMKDR